MSILKKNINLHPFTAPTAENITAGAGINDTDTAGNSDTGGKEGGEPQYLPSEATRAKICKMQRAECERLLTEAMAFLNITSEIRKRFSDTEKELAESKKELAEYKKSLAYAEKKLVERKKEFAGLEMELIERKKELANIEVEKKLLEYKKKFTGLELELAEHKKELADEEKVLADVEKGLAAHLNIESKIKPFIEAVTQLLEKRLAEIETESEAD